MRWILLTVALVALAAPASARAQSSELLVPESFRAAPGETPHARPPDERGSSSELIVPEVFRTPAGERGDGGAERASSEPRAREPLRAASGRDGASRDDLRVPAMFRRAPGEEADDRAGWDGDLRVPAMFGVAARRRRPLDDAERARPLSEVRAEALQAARSQVAWVGPYWIPVAELCRAEATHGPDAPVDVILAGWSEARRRARRYGALLTLAEYRLDACPEALGRALGAPAVTPAPSAERPAGRVPSTARPREELGRP